MSYNLDGRLVNKISYSCRNVVLECLHYNITPMVTLSHFDMPYSLEPQHWMEGQEDDIGWVNNSSPEWFQNFAITNSIPTGPSNFKWQI